MSDRPPRIHAQRDAYSSPWTMRTRLAGLAWRCAWTLLARWTPKVASPWRAALLRVFGARIRGRVFVDSSVRVRMPWNLAMDERACLGPGVDVYNLAPVTLGARCTIAQEVALCTGTHDFSTKRLPLATAPVAVGADAFVGMRAIVLPGVRVGVGCVVGAGSVVTRDTPEWTICGGNPCRPIKPRTVRDDV